MRLETRTADGVTIIDIHGKIRIGQECAEFRNAVRDLLKHGKRKILLNLSDVSHMDSSGIGELMGSYVTVTNQSGELKLVNLTKRLHELLAIVKLTVIFDCFDDEAMAIASYEP